MESCGIDERYLSEKASKPPSKRRKARSWLRRWKDVALKHTWFTPLVILIILLSAYAVNPTPSNPMHSAIFLSYRREPKYQGEPVMYGKGKKDLAFVAFYTVLLSFTREFLMQKVIRPWAHHCGIHSKAKVVRFMEQVYTAIYFSVFGPFGLYVMSKTDIWYFNTTAMFEEFPHREHEAHFKAYYLLEASYWAQQAIVLVLQLEKPRKDFKELVWHHIITLSLIGLSYRFHFTHIGLAVYITHDISDLFLATSKTLNYLDSPLMAPFFTVFVLMWVYQRHYLNLKILWAVLTKFRTVGPFELNWETQQYKCWISQIITFVLLASLQAVNLFWLYLIFRVSKNYVFNVTIADERSDNEGEEEEEVPSKELSNGSVPNAGNNIHSFAAKQNFARENKSPQVLLNGELVNAPILRANGKKSH
jgi:acyl-CoA-dependent ceramide synthase